MNNITDLLDLEDSDIKISDIIIEGQTKTLIIETPPVASYCPICGFRMHSRGVKKRTINHPILQDGYSLILLLKQRRWRCSNPDCLYEVNESFRFVNKGRRTTNATDMLIVEAYRNLLEHIRIYRLKDSICLTHMCMKSLTVMSSLTGFLLQMPFPLMKFT